MPRRPPKEHQFKPGKSGNPSGRPSRPPEVIAAAKITQNNFIILVNKYLSMDRESITAAAQDPKVTTLDLIVLKVIQQAIAKGDQIRLAFILDRLIGKVPLPLDVSIDPETIEKIKMFEAKSTEELLAILNASIQSK